MPKSIEMGKLAEFKVIAHLVRMGFTVYVPVVDTGVDLVAERLDANSTVYYGLQVKSSGLSKSGAWAWNVDPKTFRVSDHNLLILLLDNSENIPEITRETNKTKESPGLYALVIPSVDFEQEYASKSLRWAEGGTYGLSLKRDQLEPGKSGLCNYLNKWDLIRSH